MAIVMEQRMEGTPSKSTMNTPHSVTGRLLSADVRALLHSTATSFPQGSSTMIDKNTLFGHPSMGMRALQQPSGSAGGWLPLSETHFQQMVLSRPTAHHSLMNFESNLNPVSLLSNLGNKTTTITTASNSSLCATTLTDFSNRSEAKDSCVHVSSKCKHGGSAVVPCRARGMPKDHNTKTAYFVIPKDIAHGEGLKCSHPECREKGIRFRYCSVCAVPVAKRNFSTRHHHGDLLEQSIRQENGLLLVRTEADIDLAKRREEIRRAKRHRTSAAVSGSCTSSLCCNSSTGSSCASSLSSSSDSETDDLCGIDVNKSAKRRKTQSSSTTEASVPKESAMERDSREYHEKWMNLLAQRPASSKNNNDSANQKLLNDWLESVVKLSEEMSANLPLRAQVEYLHENYDATMAPGGL